MAACQQRDVTNGDGSQAPRRSKHSCQSTLRFGPHFPLMENYEAAMRRGCTGRNVSGRRRRARACRSAQRDPRTMKHLRQGVLVPYGGGWLMQPRQGADMQPCDSTSVDPALLHAAIAHLNGQCRSDQRCARWLEADQALLQQDRSSAAWDSSAQ
jgi:hypothetical protein